MKNITINNNKKLADLEREITLNNRALVLQKNNGEIVNVFMVISFRDHKNCYNGDPTNSYCTLLNLDNGAYPFEERCSRHTTVRRVLNHLLRIGCANYGYNASIPVKDYGNYDIEVLTPTGYKLDITF